MWDELVYVETTAEVLTAFDETAAEEEDEALKEDEELDAASDKIPPTAPPGGDVEVVAFLARSVNAARVLPVAGLLGRRSVSVLGAIEIRRKPTR